MNIIISTTTDRYAVFVLATFFFRRIWCRLVDLTAHKFKLLGWWMMITVSETEALHVWCMHECTHSGKGVIKMKDSYNGPNHYTNVLFDRISIIALVYSQIAKNTYWVFVYYVFLFLWLTKLSINIPITQADTLFVWYYQSFFIFCDFLAMPSECLLSAQPTVIIISM